MFEAYYPTIPVSFSDLDEKKICGMLFDFDAEEAFKSVEFSLS